MLRLENWKNVGFGENGVMGDLDNLRESSWDATAKTGRSERWLGTKLQKTVAFLGMKKSEEKRKKKKEGKWNLNYFWREKERNEDWSALPD